MARGRLEIGKTGDVWYTEHPAHPRAVRAYERDRQEGKSAKPPKTRWQARCRVRDQDGRIREVSATGETKGAAKRALERRLEARRDPASGRNGDLPRAEVHDRMTVAELAAYWLEHKPMKAVRGDKSRRLSDSTLAIYESTIRTQVNPHFGDHLVVELTDEFLEGRLHDLAKRQSVAQLWSVLGQVLDLAVKRRVLDSNPLDRVDAIYRERGDVQALSTAAVAALRALLREHESPPRRGGRRPNTDLSEVVDFILGTGCRIGEALAVRWRDLYLDTDIPLVTICGTLREPRKGYISGLERSPATKSRRDRTLVLPSAVLKTLRERRSRTQWNRDDDFVFASARGTALWPNNIRTRLRKAVNGHPDLDGITPHTLRRTYATLVAHGMGIDAAQESLGHSTPAVTQRAYVARRTVAPDVTHLLDGLFATPDPSSAGITPE